jgi:hypothetical protein
VYGRPGEAWACFTKGPVPVFTKMTPNDQSDDSHFCQRLGDLEDEAKLVYFTAKALAKMGEIVL